MRCIHRLLLSCVCVLGLLVVPGIASGHDLESDLGIFESTPLANPAATLTGHSADHAGSPGRRPFDGPQAGNLTIVGNSGKDGTTNSHLAFWEDLAFPGNYNGLRTRDIRHPAHPLLLSGQ